MDARAIVFPTPDRVEVQSFPLPDLRPGEMRVRTEYSGVSQATEIWALTGRRVELAFPTVPGYQAVSVVEEAGAEVIGFAPGQRVLFKSSRLPESFPPTWMGAHVSYALITDAVPLPDTVDPVAAALSALAAVSLRGIRMVEILPGDLVAVTGQGLIGQGSAQLARLRGGIVVATDLSATRREKSAALSADVVVDPAERDLAEVVREIKPGGADVVIGTTGRSEMFGPSIALLREGGQLLLQGYYPDPITMDFWTTHLKRPTIAVTCGFDNEGVATCLDLMARGRLRYRELVTHLVPVGEAPALYARMAAADPALLGVVFDWREA